MIGVMRCTTLCTASSYDLHRLQPFLTTMGLTQAYRDVLHLQVPKGKTVRGDIFFFDFGTIVCWGLTHDEEREILPLIKKFEKEPHTNTEIDDYTYTYGTQMKIDEDQIYLPNKNIMTKLAISYGFAQSTKLSTFEELIDKTIQNTKPLPIDLARRGKIRLSRREISRKIGEIYIERTSINLHSEILDIPEFFWEHPKLETYYLRTSHYLDINGRTEILNKRLGVLHELFEILTNELDHQHSSRLEWTIIILILIEVFIALFHDIFHII
ncbi:MAG: hypothetical protein K940chlam2_00544 [Chlamydiae bacterium]|nr:hypothetical protein [Chlamydiota bacterium]